MTRQEHIANRNNACLLASNLRGMHITDAVKWEYAMKRWQLIHEAQE